MPRWINRALDFVACPTNEHEIRIGERLIIGLVASFFVLCFVPVAILLCDHSLYCRIGHYETQHVAGRMDYQYAFDFLGTQVGGSMVPVYVPAHDEQVWVCEHGERAELRAKSK